MNSNFGFHSILIVALGITFLFGECRAADDVVSMTMEGLSQSDVPSVARAESLKEALSKATMQIIGGLIGEARLEKNRSVITAKIIPQTGKFVPFYKASEPLKKGNETITSVSMKISITSLKEILSREGLLYQSEGLATVMPMVRFVDKRENGSLYRWWSEEKGPQNALMHEQAIVFNKQLDAAFRAHNFYLIDAVSEHYVQLVPDPFRVDSISPEDLSWFGEFFKAQIAITGDITFLPVQSDRRIKTQVKFSATNIGNGRTVGEISRTFEDEAPEWNEAVLRSMRKNGSDMSKDLANQVLEEWTKGTFGATLLKIVLHGNLGFKDIELFKSQITTKIGDIKTIHERLQKKGYYVFEVDAAGGLAQLTKSLEKTSFEGFKLALDGFQNDEVEMRWSKVGRE